MATKVGLAKIWMTPLDWPTPKPPHWCKIQGSILNAIGIIVIFVWIFPTFRYHGNKGWSDTNFSYTVKSAVPEKPYLAQESWWCHTKMTYTWLSDQIYHGNKGGSSENLNDSIRFYRRKTPTLMKNSGIYFNASGVIVIFVWKFPTFRYHGNRGWSTQI